MTYGVLLALLAAVMWTGNAWAYTLAARRGLAVIPFAALASGLGAIGALVLVDWHAPWQAQTPRDLAWPLIATALSGVTSALSVIFQVKTFVLGHKGISWTVAQMAMVISFLAGVIIWREPAHGVQYAGLAAVLGAVALFMPREKGPPSAAPARASGRWLLYLLAAFAVSGMAQVFYIMPSRHEAQLCSGIRAGLLLATGAAFSGTAALLLRQGFRRAMLGPALILAVCSVLGLLFSAMSGNAFAACHLAGLVYPVATGGSVMLFALVSRFVLKETFHVATWAAMALGIAGIVLLSTR